MKLYFDYNNKAWTKIEPDNTIYKGSRYSSKIEIVVSGFESDLSFTPILCAKFYNGRTSGNFVANNVTYNATDEAYTYTWDISETNFAKVAGNAQFTMTIMVGEDEYCKATFIVPIKAATTFSNTILITDENASQVVNDMQDEIDTLETNVGTLQTNLASEITNRKSAISDEAAARESADETEKNRAYASELNLQEQINTEKETRASTDVELQTSIDSEITNRKSADEKLQSQINTLNKRVDRADFDKVSEEIADVKEKVDNAIQDINTNAGNIETNAGDIFNLQDSVNNLNDTIGTGATSGTILSRLSALEGKESAVAFEVVSELPTASVDTLRKIYLVPNNTEESDNVYNEYITVYRIIDGVNAYTFELLGSISGAILDKLYGTNIPLTSDAGSKSITEVVNSNTQSINTVNDAVNRLTQIDAGTRLSKLELEEANAYTNLKNYVGLPNPFPATYTPLKTRVEDLETNISNKANSATTLAGYGITDASITDNKTITLGSNSITPYSTANKPTKDDIGLDKVVNAGQTTNYTTEGSTDYFTAGGAYNLYNTILNLNTASVRAIVNTPSEINVGNIKSGDVVVVLYPTNDTTDIDNFASIYSYDETDKAWKNTNKKFPIYRAYELAKSYTDGEITTVNGNISNAITTAEGYTDDKISNLSISDYLKSHSNDAYIDYDNNGTFTIGDTKPIDVTSSDSVTITGGTSGELVKNRIKVDATGIYLIDVAEGKSYNLYDVISKNETAAQLTQNATFAVLTATNGFSSQENATFSKNVNITGNLTVSGTTTAVNTTNLTVTDKVITLANNNTTALLGGAGIMVPKYDGTNYGALLFDANGTAYVGDLTTSKYSDDSDIVITDHPGLIPIMCRAAASDFAEGDVIIWNSETQSACSSDKKITDYYTNTQVDNLFTTKVDPVAAVAHTHTNKDVLDSLQVVAGSTAFVKFTED